MKGLREVSKLKTKVVSTNKDLGVVREEEQGGAFIQQTFSHPGLQGAILG